MMGMVLGGMGMMEMTGWGGDDGHEVGVGQE